MANIVTGIFSGVKFFIENPLWTLAIILGILLMPLEVFDLILFVLVNLIVVIINVIIFILFTLFNIIVIGINFILEKIWLFLQIWGYTAGKPTLPMLDFVPQPYITVNLFSPDKNLLIIIVELMGETLPFW